MKRSRPNPRNPQRRQKNFARAYHSSERVQWVQRLPCSLCGRGPSENAHTETGGMGRKADYTSIVPLCSPHHRSLHDHGVAPATRTYLREEAVRINALWDKETL